MSETRHERPGVYSAYDASAVVSAGAAPKNIGVAAKAAGGTVGAAVTLTGYAAGVERKQWLLALEQTRKQENS